MDALRATSRPACWREAGCRRRVPARLEECFGPNRMKALGFGSRPRCIPTKNSFLSGRHTLSCMAWFPISSFSNKKEQLYLQFASNFRGRFHNILNGNNRHTICCIILFYLQGMFTLSAQFHVYLIALVLSLFTWLLSLYYNISSVRARTWYVFFTSVISVLEWCQHIINT